MCWLCLSASTLDSIKSYLTLIALFRSSNNDMWSTYHSSRARISTRANFRSLSNSSAIENTFPSLSFSLEYFSSILSSSGCRWLTCLLALVAFISSSRILFSFSLRIESRDSFSISLSMISFSKTSTSARKSINSLS